MQKQKKQFENPDRKEVVGRKIIRPSIATSIKVKFFKYFKE
jgi:hypothetical protein